MALAIFDLDNTLIGGDSDVLWGDYLAECGYVDGELQRREHKRFYDEYMQGTLDIHEFLRFQLRVLKENELEHLYAWRADYLQKKIAPIMLTKGMRLLDKHRQAGRRLLIITATNRFLTAPIAESLGVDDLIATEPEMVANRYTGGVSGVPSYARGKVVRLRAWLTEHRESLEESWFYSDSNNDLPLLEEVTYPVAVDPDEKLRSEALRRGWPTISLR